MAKTRRIDRSEGAVALQVLGTRVRSLCDAPAHAAGFFREADLEVRSMPEDGAKVPVIGARHGVHFLPRDAG